MSRKRRNGHKSEIDSLNELLLNNGKAIEEGPKKKTWSKHDLKTIKPLTPTQEEMFHAWFNGFNLAVHGSTGTGKTFLAFYLALTELFKNTEYKQIILVRSAVPTREVGFLPGTYEEKIAQYELPYHDILWQLIGRQSTYQDMKDAGVIKFMTTSFIRGLTWDNSIVIVDEGENMTFHEIDSIMTRMGEHSRIIFTGDLVQTDLTGLKRNGECGMQNFLKAVQDMQSFRSISFGVHDIVRSEFVKSWIMASERYFK